MQEWVRTIIGTICILTVLINLIPNGKFAGYVRFYAGLIFFLMAAAPILQWFTGEGELERFLEIAFLKEEYSDLETAVEGMSDLKSEQIRIACQKELQRQVGAIASAYGGEATKVQVSFGEPDGYGMTGVSLCLPEGTDAETKDRIRKELAAVFELPEARIQISGT